MTTKVQDTVSHKTSQGDVIVAKGKLILIPVHDKKGLVTIPNNFGGWNHFNPIIISDKEIIEIGDYAYEGWHKELWLSNVKGNNINHCKVLALPENFSPKQIQAIIDGKLKEDDEVYVECAESPTGGNRIGYDEADMFDYVKLNNQNQIILHKIEKDLLAELWKEYHRLYENTKKGETYPDVPPSWICNWVKTLK